MEELIRLRNEMRELLVGYAGMTVETFDRPFANLDKLSMAQLQRRIAFMKIFYNDYYRELKRIYQLPLDPGDDGKTLWQSYFQCRKYHLVEMQLFRKQAYRCRVAWKAFKKEGTNGKTTHNQNSDTENTQRISA